MGKCDEVIVDEIEFYNAGNYANPETGVKMKGRSKDDLKTQCIARGRGRRIEDLQDRIENEIDIGFEEESSYKKKRRLEEDKMVEARKRNVTDRKWG